MNSAATSYLTDSSSDLTLGWNAMPAYGEVLPDLVGIRHLDINAPLAPEPAANNAMHASFWDSIRSGVALAA